MITFGAGFTPAYLSLEANTVLQIPTFVTYVELGLTEYKRWLSQNIAPELSLSLHLARTPVTEPPNAQDIFISHVKGKIKPHPSALTSIGIHLTGLRSAGIGQLGFSSHFIPSQNAEKNAIRFVGQLQAQIGLPVWIENANFYSGSSHDIFETWKCIDRICRITGAGLIVDLSHLLIDAKNNGISPTMILGIVPWEYIAEIHLSGVIEARDGSFHDGHSRPVHDSTWELLDECLNYLIPTGQPIVITIEHTDPCWADEQHIYNADFLRLKNVVESKNPLPVNFSGQAGNYAQGYLKKLLKQRIPQLMPACEQRGVSFDSLFDNWVYQVTQQEGRRIVLTEDEASADVGEVCLAAPEFLQFAKKQLIKCKLA